MVAATAALPKITKAEDQTEYIPWDEIYKLIKAYGFDSEWDTFAEGGDPAEESRWIHLRRGPTEFTLGFNRVADFAGKKYTYAWISEQTNKKYKRGPRGLLNPTKWEKELRTMIESWVS